MHNGSVPVVCPQRAELALLVCTGPHWLLRCRRSPAELHRCWPHCWLWRRLPAGGGCQTPAGCRHGKHAAPCRTLLCWGHNSACLQSVLFVPSPASSTWCEPHTELCCCRSQLMGATLHLCARALLLALPNDLQGVSVPAVRCLAGCAAGVCCPSSKTIRWPPGTVLCLSGTPGSAVRVRDARIPVDAKRLSCLLGGSRIPTPL